MSAAPPRPEAPWPPALAEEQQGRFWVQLAYNPLSELFLLRVFAKRRSGLLARLLGREYTWALVDTQDVRGGPSAALRAYDYARSRIYAMNELPDSVGMVSHWYYSGPAKHSTFHKKSEPEGQGGFHGGMFLSEAFSNMKKENQEDAG